MKHMPANPIVPLASQNIKMWSRHRLSVFILLLYSVCSALSPASAEPVATQGNAKVRIYFFWGDGCPHCEKEKVYLDEISRKYSHVEIRSYEVWKNQPNAVFFSRMAAAAGVKSTGVPVTFIGNKAFAGFSDRTAEEIENRVQYCIGHKDSCGEPSNDSTGSSLSERHQIISIPLLGYIDMSEISLPVISIVLGGMDGFNPCAFFVLFFLLSLLIHAKSRKKMILIGGTFVFFSGFLYFIFMAAWLNVFLVARQVMVITIIAGIVALVVSLINIKDFFLFKKGISLSIPEKAKPRLFEQMRSLLKSSSVASMLTATIFLAIAANTYELLCTAGFPMVFTRILTLHNLPTMQYYFYLSLYIATYVLPLTAIVVTFTVTLGAKKLSAWQGRRLKLLSGLMMFFLGLILLIDPSLLNTFSVGIGLLTLVFVLYVLIVFSAKKLLPQITEDVM